MASQTRSYDKKKLLGQIYTPPHIVEKILTNTGFYTLDFSATTILDPACGDGRFLVPIAKYIIETVPENIVGACLKNLSGWDIDPEALTICRKNLNELIEHLHFEVDWNLCCKDALQQLESIEKYDLIIGNPPYIRIQHLPVTQRKYIQSAYSFCRSGSTDTYIAFFQLACHLLSESGVCGFITPNSFLSSETGKPLRSYFSENQNLMQITNYGSVRIFGNTGTYAAITLFCKAPAVSFNYEVSNSDLIYTSREIPFTEILGESKWRLSITGSKTFAGAKLGDLCKISVGITTLSDSQYLFKITDETDGIAEAVNKSGIKVLLEKALLKPIIKGSKLKTSLDVITEYILFPYEQDSLGKHKIIPEEKIRTLYPKAYAYFISIREILDKRDNGKRNTVAWYAFGRAQGLDTSFGKKIIFSPMNRFPNFVLYQNPDCTVYSGYFLKYDGDYEALLSQLNSQRMADFISISGRDFQGGYKGYNKKTVENFIILPFGKEIAPSELN